MRGVPEKIRKRGYWIVRVHPQSYATKQRRALAELENAVRQSVISVRGWDFPHVDSRVIVTRTAEYVEQSLDWEHYVELWRAYRSGQFVSMSALWDDWRDQSRIWPPLEGWKPGVSLSVGDAVFRFVEVYEFAVRWSQALGVGDAMVIVCTLRGLENRSLQLGPGRVPFVSARRCTVPEWSHSDTCPVPDLLSRSRELAAVPAVSLFELFGWDTTVEQIRDIQTQLRR